MYVTFTVFFDDPFWVGLYKIEDETVSRCARIVFSGAPADVELYDYFLRHYNDFQFTDYADAENPVRIRNPKRRQREISKLVHDNRGVKKSYDTIKKLQHTATGKKKRTDKKALETERKNRLLIFKHQKQTKRHKCR
jgi:hypothetical protein